MGTVKNGGGRIRRDSSRVAFRCARVPNKTIVVIKGGSVMKLLQRITMGLIFLGLGAVASAQTADSAADGVRAADAAWLKVYSAKDLNKSVAFFDDQGSMLSPNDPIATGKAAISKLIASDFSFGNLTWQVDKAGVSKSGDLGYTSGRYKRFRGNVH